MGRGSLLIAALIVLVTTRVSYAKDNRSKSDYFKKDRSSYNLVCKHRTGEVLLNTYNFTVGITLKVGSPDPLHLETLLLERDADCDNCYFITARFEEIQYDNVYSFNYFNENNKNYVDIYEVLENTNSVVLVKEYIPCKANPAFKIVTAPDSIEI